MDKNNLSLEDLNKLEKNIPRKDLEKMALALFMENNKLGRQIQYYKRNEPWRQMDVSQTECLKVATILKNNYQQALKDSE